MHVSMYVCVRERGENGGRDNTIKTFWGCFAEMFYKHDYREHVLCKCKLQSLDTMFIQM